MSPRETRYRRLLGLYPADFRREYADEMVGVLMADSRSARSQIANLVAGAVAAHFRQTLGGSAWRRAAGAIQLFGAVMLAALAMRRLVVVPARELAGPLYTPQMVDEWDVVRAGAWAVVVVAALAGLRWLGVASALVGLGGEIAAPLRHYVDTPATFLDVYWIVLTAAVVLVASVFAVCGARPRGWLLVVAAGVALAGSGVDLVASYAIGAALAGHGTPVSPSASAGSLFLFLAAMLSIAAVIRLEPEVRRRVIAGAVPVLGAFPLVRVGFGGLEEFNMRHPESVRLLGPGQWAALVVIPVVAFWLAARLNQRLELSRAAAVQRR